MKKFLNIGLGILAALGGFVDIGDLIFAFQGGAKFGLHLLWALVLGTVLIMVYAEMSGRVATITKLPVFTIIRQRSPKKLGIVALVSSSLVNLITCAAEIGGVALILQLMSGLPYRALAFAFALALVLIIWLLPFEMIEKLFGYLGLCLLVIVVVALKTHPTWQVIGHGIIPSAAGGGWLDYAYFSVGLIAATVMPYEVYFYCSGAIEEHWKPSDLVVNKANAILGFGLGALLVASILLAASHYFGPLGIKPEFAHTPALAGLIPFGQAGVLLMLLGMLFSICGSAIETCFAGAYNIAQYMDWKWGKNKDPLQAPHFTKVWLGLLLAAFLIIVTGFDPITVAEYAVVFSVVVMPLTYFPILWVARDSKLMGKYKNRPWNNALAWACLAVICLISVAAVPLMILTQRGQA